MYINDVIRRVRGYYPNEYDTTELYSWCDEVSAILAVEDRPTYKEKVLPLSADGTVYLPDGVKFENIERVIADGVELKKEDIRDFAKSTINIKGYNAKVRDASILPKASSVTVVYLAPYEPIRLCKYNGSIKIHNSSTIKIKNSDFVVGDILTMQGSDNNVIAPAVPVIQIDYEPFDEYAYTLTSTDDALSDITSTDFNGIITRTVTDETLCDAPYDSMYIDYVIAKINMYQRDIAAYNQHMTLFNSKLDSYKKWIVSRMPQSRSTFINWW